MYDATESGTECIHGGKGKNLLVGLGSHGPVPNKNKLVFSNLNNSVHCLSFSCFYFVFYVK